MNKEYKFKIPAFDISKSFDSSCITVVSANVRCYTTGDRGKKNWYWRAPFFVQTLIDANADIIGLQECM
ncbi:MAG: hypothetical protein K6C14_04580, partial [Eubacterium sp.]|nr:hypothetical protein [Eubacterium sp.]